MTKVLTHFYWHGFAANAIFYSCVGKEPTLLSVIFAGLFSWGGFIGSLSAKVIG